MHNLPKNSKHYKTKKRYKLILSHQAPKSSFAPLVDQGLIDQSMTMSLPVSIGRLTLLLTTLGQQVAFLTKHDIFPSLGTCQKCNRHLKEEVKQLNTRFFFYCKKCDVRTTIRHGTVLYNSNMKMSSFVMLAYCFTIRNRTGAQSE